MYTIIIKYNMTVTANQFDDIDECKQFLESEMESGYDILWATILDNTGKGYVSLSVAKQDETGTTGQDNSISFSYDEFAKRYNI